MQSGAITANVTVVNPMGMHLRPAALFVRTASQFQARVTVTYLGQQCDVRSVIELLMLAARQGTEIVIAAEGEEAAPAVAALVDLVRQGFGELEPDATLAAGTASNMAKPGP